jgi:hypothetical protein
VYNQPYLPSFGHSNKFGGKSKSQRHGVPNRHLPFDSREIISIVPVVHTKHSEVDYQSVYVPSIMNANLTPLNF